MERKAALAPPLCPACGYPTPPAGVGQEASCDQCHGTIHRIDDRRSLSIGARFFVADLSEGFLSIFRAGLLLMTRREFVHKLFWPVVVNALACAVLFGGSFWAFSSLFGTWLDVTWLQWSRGWVGNALAFILSVVAVLLLAPALVETVTSPFLDPLAETTEAMITGARPQRPPGSFMAELSFGLRNSARILTFQILILVPALLLSFIPLLFFLPLLAAAYLNALIWFEIPVMRRGFEMDYRRWVVRRNWARALGFGLGFQLALFVPFFNLFFLTPAAAVAVSQLYFRFEKVPDAR